MAPTLAFIRDLIKQMPPVRDELQHYGGGLAYVDSPPVHRELQHYGGGGLAYVGSPPPSPPPPHPPPALPPHSPPNPPPFIPWVPAEALQSIVVLLVVALIGVMCCCVPLYLLRDKATLTKICKGRATSRLVNALCCLPVLGFNSSRAYLKPCLRSYLAAFVDGCLCALPRLLCKRCWRHTDKTFPPGPRSLGEWEGKQVKDGDVEWVRARELLVGTDAAKEDASKKTASSKAYPKVKVDLAPNTRVKLFEGDIDPKDVGQGAVGGTVAAIEPVACLQSGHLTSRV